MHSLEQLIGQVIGPPRRVSPPASSPGNDSLETLLGRVISAPGRRMDAVPIIVETTSAPEIPLRP